MKLTDTMKRLLSALLVFVLVVSLVPVNAFAATSTGFGTYVDAALFFSDLHTNKSDYKDSTIRSIMGGAASSGVDFSSVTSVGDAFSVNGTSSGGNDGTFFTGDTSKITASITAGLNDPTGFDMNYAWSDHDRMSDIADYTGLAYGDASTNYYVYMISMSDTATNDRYKTGVFGLDQATLDKFTADVAKMDHSKPLFIASHQPLLDRRGDNGNAYKWYQVISAAAEKMDIVFLWGHNHRHDVASDYYYGKGSNMPVEDNGTTRNVTMNFAHVCAGYMAPDSTGSTSSTTRKGTVMAAVVKDNSIQLATYGANGKYTGNYALDVTIPRDHAGSIVVPPVTEPAETQPVVTEPVVTEPAETEPKPTQPAEPEVPEVGTDWIDLPSGNTYVLDTDGIDSGAKYLIVAKSYAKALTAASSKSNASDVTISGNTATADPAYGWTFTASGNGYQISKEGTYLGRSSSSLATGSSGTVWTVSSQGSGNYNVTQTSSSSWWGGSTYYVRWSNSNGYFQASTSSKDPVRLYKYTGNGIGAEYIRLAGDLQQNYVTADAASVNTVLGKVKVQTSNDGVNVSGEIAVTSDMVTWNTAFNGKTAGTYTGTVTYEGLELGTITVIITAQHNYETVTVAATCTKAGSVTTTCTVCGDSSVEEIPALGHEYTCATTDATCGKDGAKVYTCVHCDDTYTEVIPATGKHTYETVTVNATCTEAGSVTTTCTVCGDSSLEEIPALGHEYTCATTDATCGKDGAKVYTCVRCDDTYTEVIAATGKHTYETVTVAATCTEAGSITTTCTVCGESSVEVLAAIGHSYDSTVTAPDCTEEGFTTYTCATCGHSYVADRTAALGHSYDSVITATCTEDGFVVYTCTVCGHSYNGEAVEAFGHSYETTVVAPTCATAGYTTYVCTTCGHTYTGNETAALGHDYDAVVTEATCTESGFTTYTCATCGHSYVADQVAALGHSYESVVTAPTFETEGFTTHTCTVCGDVKVDSYVPVLSHTYETVTVDATCTEDGSVTHTCVTCGYTYTEVLPAIGHTFETVTVDATCTENGSIVSTCTNCGDVETEVIPALGHSFEITRFEATCTEPGFVTSTCACGHVVTQEIPALGHSYESAYVAPGCDTNGGTTYTCHCGHSYTDVISALGHSYTSQSVAPTCTKEGYTTYTCGTCGDSYVGDKTAALGHSYEGVVTVPTCTESGFTTYTCAVCGDSYVGDKTAALGHSNTEVVTAPTCTEAGYTTYTCTVCGHSSMGNSVAALGHSYTSVESNGYMVYTCRCGDSYSEKIENLTYTRVSSISSGNSYVITLYSGNKYYALSHANNQISVVQVSYSNKQITSEVTEDLVWNYSNKKLSYENGGKTYYLHAQSASGWWGWMSAPTLTLSTSSSTTVSFSSNKLKLGSYYLRYSSGKVSLNRSATTTYFFIEE